MKIAFLIDQYAHPRAGTERQLLLLARSLGTRGHETELGVLRPSAYTDSGAFPSPVTTLGVARVASPSAWWKLLRWGRRLRRNGFRLVQIYFNDAAVLGPIPLRLAGLKVVVCRRDMGFWYTPLKLALLRAAAPAVNALVANSRAAGAAACKAEGIAPSKLEVIYNGLESCVPAAVGITVPPSPGRRIGIVANVRPIKRIDDLIRAFRDVLRAAPDTDLAIVGGGDDTPLRSLAASLGVADRVHFAGSSEAPQAWIATFDVGVICSESEGLANVVLEYMQQGKPVVASRTGGNPELVEDGVNGFLYPVGNVGALAEALCRLLREPESARRMGRAGAALARDRFSLERMVERQLALFERLTGAAAHEGPVRVLHLIDSGGLYGAERLILMLAGARVRAGRPVWVATIVAPHDDGDPLGDAARRAGIPVKQFSMADGLNIRGVREIVAFARAERVDIIHAHGYRANILLGLLPKRARPSVVSTLHGFTSTGRGLSRMRVYEALEKRLLRRLDAVVAVSGTMLEDRRLARLRSKVRVIPNGIDVEEAAPAPASHDDIIAFVRDRPALVCIGRLSAEKGVDLLVAALPGVRERVGDVGLVLIGAGPEAPRLEQQARALGVSENILFAGFRERPQRYLRFFDALVLPSRTEGLPLVVLEAMAAGTAVVASPVGAVPEVLEHGADGVLLARAGDVTALVEGIAQVLSQPGLRERLRTAGPRRVAEAFSAAACAERYEQLYRLVTSA
jgi:L-malate glycosyltransferase